MTSDRQVLVVGEALVDVVDHGEGPVASPGGSPMNVAVGTARLGHDTTLVTAFGDDDHGALLDRHLTAAGVHVVRAGSRTEPTSTARAEIGPDGSAVYEFDLRWDVDAVPPLRAAVLHVGSVAAFTAPGAAAVEAALAAAAPDTVRTFDPNLRPALLPERVETDAAVRRIAARCHVVKLSDEDLAWLWPGRPPEEAITAFLDEGVPLVAVTLGARGSVAASPRGTVLVPALRVPVVDTIGAGDAWTSGILHALVDRGIGAGDLGDGLPAETVTELVRTATASAAHAVSQRGAVPPDRAALRRMLAA